LDQTRLEEIGAYIEINDPSAAKRVVVRIATAVEVLALHPKMARVGRLKGTREMVLADISYIVPYRVEGTRVEILTVMHVAQRWPLKL
jgi:plasmid stabilization system protein ParE